MDFNYRDRSYLCVWSISVLQIERTHLEKTEPLIVS